MAYVMCPEHGGHGAAAVCSHVVARLRARQAIVDKLVPVRANYAGITLGPTWPCPDCAARFGVPAGGATWEGDDGFDRYWSGIDWWPVCPQCFGRGRAAAEGQCR